MNDRIIVERAGGSADYLMYALEGMLVECESENEKMAEMIRNMMRGAEELIKEQKKWSADDE
ncbi:MAG: hypothetical protein LBU47_01920 [Christensenellaceae bacterium]|nr:hypothetical protein [Christensenellaceae bacterium]